MAKRTRTFVTVAVAALLGMALTAWAAPSSLDARVDALVARFAPDAIEIRHRLHQNPELSNRETKTAALVAEKLRALGLEPRTGIAHTGVVAVLKGGKPGPFIAVRADMDALPVTEDTDLPFKSTARSTYLGQDVGVTHACGHDIHVAVQLGVASILTAIKDQVPGTIQFIFQPAEEGAPPGEQGGAELMLKEGIWKDAKPNAVFGLHVNAQTEVGQIWYNPGPTMAAADMFRISSRELPSHGARPELSVDPVVVGLAGRPGPPDDPLAQRLALRPLRAHGRNHPRRPAQQHHSGGGGAARHGPHLRRQGAGSGRASHARSPGRRHQVGAGPRTLSSTSASIR